MVEFDKIDFHKYLKSINAKNCTFFYYANGNDPCNPCGTVCKQAKYEFYVIAEGLEKLIVYKNHRRSHDIVESQLRKKFERWATEYFKKTKT
jgi:hypothetical protein